MELFISGTVALVLAGVFGSLLVPILHKLKFGQSIRDEGPRWHKKKSGTPTMGGFIFILAALAATFTFTQSYDAFVIMICALLFGAIGFADDYIKVVKKRNLGLSASQKFAAQLLIAAAFIVFLIYKGMDMDILIPFTKTRLDLGFWYIPLTIIFVVGMVNSVNLTDGLDGLASFISLIIALFFAAITWQTGASGAAIACAALAGGLLGFLIYNIYPAKVFMGDTGSLFLGGFLAAISVRYGLELFLFICGGMFLVETASVILQVFFFKLTGKRIFKMSPIHHHFEMCGMRESKIVVLFTAITIALCIAAYFGVK